MLGMKAFDAGRDEARMPDVVLVSVSEPNEAGYVHFGPHMWNKKSYARRAKHTIAVTDPNLSPVFGDVWMHVGEIGTFITGAVKPVDMAAVRHRVETLAPEENRAALLAILEIATPDQVALVEDAFHMLPPSLLQQALGASEIDAEARAIADHIRPLIRDGDTIQVGSASPARSCSRQEPSTTRSTWASTPSSGRRAGEALATRHPRRLHEDPP
jgi:4-hydroxybutyrate CoA-transferase